MTSQRRVQQQSGYILHHRHYRDSSQILDVLTQDYGKVSVVARGSRAAKSRLAGILRPFLPLRLSWVARSGLGTLTGAEAAGRPAGLTGDSMLSAYYVNELLLYFLHGYDSQPEVYALYAEVIDALARTDSVAAILRSFELELLSLLGYAVNLEHEHGSDDELDPVRNYEYRMEKGLVSVERSDGRLVFGGHMLQAIAKQEFEDPDVLRSASRLLREVIAFHLGGKEIKSRKVLVEMHRGRIAPSSADTTKDD